jgi:hypothetical protein
VDEVKRTGFGAVWQALVAVLLCSSATSAAPAPRIVCRSDGNCSVSGLPPALQDAEVLDFLKSGLTTTLVVSLNARGEGGQKLSASIRIDVRFEPWEETFSLEVARPGTPPEGHKLANEVGLHAWWKNLTLAYGLSAEPRGTATVTFELVPFSEKEQADARRWYAEAMRSSASGRGGRTGGLGTDPSNLGMLDSLTITSIQRHGVLRFSWAAPVERVR